MAIPLPPLAGKGLSMCFVWVGCSLASTPGGGPEIRITLPGALKGQRSYAFAVTAQSPVVEPPSPGAKTWRSSGHFAVWVQSVAAQRLLYVGDGEGFPLVPKLQEATVYPFRALGDAYLTQSFLLPRGASLVSLRVEFAIPFVSPGSLGQRLEVAVEAPEGFSLGSGRSCEVRSLQLGRDVVPESWYDCSAPSPLNLLLSSRVPPPAELEGIGNQLTYKAVVMFLMHIFMLMMKMLWMMSTMRLWNLRAFACTTSLDPLQEESDAATGSQDSSLCALLAASTGIPSWTMSGYLHVDQLIVEEADSMDQGSAAGQWLQQHTPSSATSQLLHLTIRGIRLNSALPAGSELRLLAPPGQSFLQPFDASMVRASGLPALDLSRCRTEEQLMVLSFQGDLSGDDGALDLSVVAQALGPTAESRDTEPWRLETRSVTGRVLGVQGNLGGFDRPSPFHFLVVTGATAAPAGGVFDLAVFFAMPEAFTLPGGSLLRLRSPLGVAFATGVTGLQLPASAAGRLRDPRLLSVRPMPSSSYLASEDTLTITLGLEGLMQGASYAFQWPAQRRVGQEAAWQPSGVAGATGPFAELLLADEVQDREYNPDPLQG
ncbi:hypothetical protein AK812_SmicGene30834 [Symbiodinium microadriaticum]|uniref:Uncharacterized protein n=1 Tax=Symbiodinium microadriaticum TaxID=2951 RepID=A0A1Q9CY98_SYMMI|nr:hypothetical protein AK812_SmicGene30834 [Symbiodinium microadriaticum]